MPRKGKATVDDQYITKEPPLDVLSGWYQYASMSAKKEHWQYFVIDQFLRGNQNIRGNPSDNSLVIQGRSDAISFPINKVFTTFRAIRAFVTRHKPMVMVEPDDQSDKAKTYARRANKILERDNKLNNFRKINKEWVYYGIKYGVGYRQVGYDTERKCAVRWSVDPNDFLIGSKTGEMEDAPFVIKTVVHTIAYWRNKYEKGKEVIPDDKLAADEYKSLALELKYQNAGEQPGIRMEERTAIGYECWYRIYEKNSVGGLINKVIFTDTVTLDFEETPYDEFPFIAYKSDVVPNEATAEGALKHVIAPQRMENLLNTQMLEYNHIVNRGRFLLDKNSGFRVINSKEGQMIFRNPGKSVQVLNPPSINPMLQWQLNFADSAIQDIGGQHDASTGAIPQRVSSGDAIEALQQGDSNNISDYRDNFEDALAQEAAWILKMYSLFEKEGILMKAEVEPGVEEEFMVMGEQAYVRTGGKVPERIFVEDNGDYCSACSVLSENQVKVSVVSQLGETRGAKLELLFQLVDRGLPLTSVLALLEFPNTEDIMQRIAEQEAAQVVMDNARNPGVDLLGNPINMGQAGPTPPGTAPTAPNAVSPEQVPAPDIMNQIQGMNSQVQGLLNG